MTETVCVASYAQPPVFAQMCKLFLIPSLFLALALTGCGPLKPKEERNPAPSSNLTKAEATALAHLYCATKPLGSFGYIATTGSMAPFLDSRTVVLYEPYTGGALHEGDIVVFDRGDSPNVIHRVIEARGDSVFISGDNNHHPDGWFPRTSIRLRVVGLLFTAR
jgi:hypothetical protein